MKMNEVLPALDQTIDSPDDAQSGSKPQGTQKPLSPGEKRQQQQKKQQGQQGSKFGQHRKSGQQQGQQKQGSANKPLRPGQKITLPTDQGDEQEFDIAGVTGNQVKIKNPDAGKDPNQPNILVYNKSDLEKSISNRK